MKNSLFLLVFIFSVGLFSCKKEETPTPTPTPQTKQCVGSEQGLQNVITISVDSIRACAANLCHTVPNLTTVDLAVSAYESRGYTCN